MDQKFCLPEEIDAIRKDVEDLAGKNIHWINDEELPAAMGARVEEGIPIICVRNFSHEGAAEELLHLQLIFEGYPILSCPTELHLEFQTATLLHNVLHHKLIYPKLKRLGYFPKISECSGVKKQLNLMERTDKPRFANEPYLRSLVRNGFMYGQYLIAVTAISVQELNNWCSLFV